MKKIALMSLGLAALTLSVLADENPSQHIQVVSLCSATDPFFQKIMEGSYPEVAIEFPAKTALPIHFSLEGDLLTFIESVENPGYIEVKQKFYARCIEKGEPVFSSNLTDWKSFSDFITGQISVDLKVEDGKPSLILRSLTNRRT